MRGKAISVIVDFIYIGITPAYAGKSFRKISKIRSLWDHPRLCGEKHRTFI